MLVRDAALQVQCISEMIIWYLFNLQKQLSRWTIMFSYETLNADDCDLNLVSSTNVLCYSPIWQSRCIENSKIIGEIV